MKHQQRSIGYGRPWGEGWDETHSDDSNGAALNRMMACAFQNCFGGVVSNVSDDEAVRFKARRHARKSYAECVNQERRHRTAIREMLLNSLKNSGLDLESVSVSNEFHVLSALEFLKHYRLNLPETQ